MTIYWPIGKFLIGIYVIFQISLWMTYQFTTDIDAIQEVGQDVLDCHLRQHLPGYSQNANDATISVDLSTTDQYLSTLTSNTSVSILNNNTLAGLSYPLELELSSYE